MQSEVRPRRQIPVRPRVRLGALVALAGIALWLVVVGLVDRTGHLISGLAVAIPGAYLLLRALVVGRRSPRPIRIVIIHAVVACAIGVGATGLVQIPSVELQIASAELDTSCWGSVLRLEQALHRIARADPGALASLSYSELGSARGILALVEMDSANERGEPPPSRALVELESILSRPAVGPLKLHVIHRLVAQRRPDLGVIGLLARAEHLAYRNPASESEWRCSRAATVAIRRRLCPGAFDALYCTSFSWVVGVVPGPHPPRYWPRDYVCWAPPMPRSPLTAVSGVFSELDYRRAVFMACPYTWFEFVRDELYLGEDGRFHLPREGEPIEHLSRRPPLEPQ